MDVLKSTTDTNKLSVKYDNLADDVDDDKCVNNHKICTNNRKNSKIIRDDTGCNVVIDNNDNGNANNQTKQLQQQPSQMKQPPFELSPQSPPLPPSSPSPSPPQQQQQQKQPSTYGCKHYKRKAKFVVSNRHEHSKQTNQFGLTIFFSLKRYDSLRFASF